MADGTVLHNAHFERWECDLDRQVLEEEGGRKDKRAGCGEDEEDEKGEEGKQDLDVGVSGNMPYVSSHFGSAWNPVSDMEAHGVLSCQSIRPHARRLYL